MKSGGCSGFEYALTLEAPRDGDEVLGADGARVYIDGEDVTTGVYQSLSGSGALFFGADTLEGAHQLEGDLDDIYVYGRALAPEELQSLLSFDACD